MATLTALWVASFRRGRRPVRETARRLERSRVLHRLADALALVLGARQHLRDGGVGLGRQLGEPAGLPAARLGEVRTAAAATTDD